MSPLKLVLSPIWRLLLPLPLMATGCQLERAAIHPRYRELATPRIAVIPVRNRTLVDLSRVEVGGPLQRAALSASPVDVPAALREGLQEALARKGYEPSDGAGGKDALLRAEITLWRLAGRQGDFAIEIEVTLAPPIASAGGLSPAGGGASGGASGEKLEALYHITHSYDSGISRRPLLTAYDLSEELHRFAARSLDELPPALAASPAPSSAAAPAAPGSTPRS